MKRFYLFVALAFALALSSCYDDSAIVGRVSDLEGRVKTLEDLCKEMNTNISSLQTIVAALQQKDYVTSVAPVTSAGEDVGYVISFEKSGPVTIYHGEDGKAGAAGSDGVVPVIGLKKHTDGVYYWTIDGDWLRDNVGDMVRASGYDGGNGADGTPGEAGEKGDAGKDGVTPQLKIEEGYWYVSYENGAEGSWQMLGKATGENGKDGVSVPSADSIFKEVDVEDPDYVEFVLNDGTTFKILKDRAIAIAVDVDSVRFSTGCSYLINYAISGADELTSMQVMASDGLTASYEQVSFEDGVAKGVITVETPHRIVERSSVVILVSDGRSKVIMKALNFIYEGNDNQLRPVFVITSADALDVSAEGGLVDIQVQTNMNYIVEIEEATKEWLSYMPSTRAGLRDESISLSAAVNSGARRYGFIYIIDVADRSLIQTICVVQAAGAGEEVKAVEFKDALFGEYIIDHYDLDLDGVVSYEEAEKITALDITDKKYTDLTGIEHMINLETLMCSGNKMSSLDLRSNALLKSLDCGDTPSIDTLNLSGCVNLEKLVCNNTGVRVLDLSAATKLKYLEAYSCSYLEKIEFRDASLLEKLVCSSCGELENIDLSTCRNLWLLDCASCALGTLNLSACRNLTTLDCSQNSLTLLDLSDCRKLSELQMWDNPLTYLDLGANPYITSLKLTTIPRVKVVSSFVKSIDCQCSSSTGTDAVNFSECPNLESVSLRYFYGDLVLSDLKKLKNVYVYAGGITNMFFDGSDNIESLELDSNVSMYGSSILDIENWGKMNLPNLKSFSAYVRLQNNSRVLDLSSCPQLSEFKFKIVSGELDTLILNNGVEIEGVTVNRSSEFIPEDVVIEYR